MGQDSEEIPTSPASRKRSYPFIQFSNPDVSPSKQSLPSPPLQSKDYLVFKKGLDTFGGSARGTSDPAKHVPSTERYTEAGSEDEDPSEDEEDGGGSQPTQEDADQEDEEDKEEDRKGHIIILGSPTSRKKNEISAQEVGGRIQDPDNLDSQDSIIGSTYTNDILRTKMGQHVLPPGIIRENALLTRRTISQPYPRKSAAALPAQPNIKLVSKPNRIKLDSGNLNAKNGVKTYILPKENKCAAISKKNESYQGHSTRPVQAAILDPGTGSQSQGKHGTNGNQSGKFVGSTPPPIQRFTTPIQSHGDAADNRPIARENSNNIYSSWSKEHLNQPINRKIKQLNRSRKFNSRYPAPEKPRQKRAVIQDMVKPLKHWLLRHRHNPYPTKMEKNDLAKNCQMTVVQVSNWFANARRRLKNVVQFRCSWSKRLRLYNRYVQGNAELLSISSDDSIWKSEDDNEDEERPDSVGYDLEDREDRDDVDDDEDEDQPEKVQVRHRDREHSYSIPGCRSPPESSELSTPGQITPYVSPPTSPPTLTPQRPLSPCSPEPPGQDPTKYKTAMLARYLEDARAAQHSLAQGSRVEVKEEVEDEYPRNGCDRDSVSPTLSKENCDSPNPPSQQTNCDAYTEPTSLQDFLKNEPVQPGYCTPEQSNEHGAPEQRRTRLQSEDLSESDNERDRDREQIKKNLDFESGRLTRDNPSPYLSSRDPPYLSSRDTPEIRLAGCVPPVGAQEEVGVDPPRDDFTPGPCSEEGYAPPTPASLPPTQNVSKSYHIPTFHTKSFQLPISTSPDYQHPPPPPATPFSPHTNLLARTLLPATQTLIPASPLHGPALLPASSLSGPALLPTSSLSGGPNLLPASSLSGGPTLLPAALIALQSPPASNCQSSPTFQRTASSPLSQVTGMLPTPPGLAHPPPPNASQLPAPPGLLSHPPNYFSWPGIAFPLFIPPETNCDMTVGGGCHLRLPAPPCWRETLRPSEYDAAMTLSQLAGGGHSNT